MDDYRPIVSGACSALHGNIRATWPSHIGAIQYSTRAFGGTSSAIELIPELAVREVGLVVSI